MFRILILQLILLLFYVCGNCSKSCGWTPLGYGHSYGYQSVGSPINFTVQLVGNDHPTTADVIGWKYIEDGADFFLSRWSYSNTKPFESICTDCKNTTAKPRIEGDFNVTTLILSLDDLSAMNGTQIYGYTSRCSGLESGTSNLLTVLAYYCTNIIQNYYDADLYVTFNDPASFGMNGTCHCSENHELRFKNGDEHGGRAMCDELARWSGCEEAQCWFAAADVTVMQRTDVAGQPVSFFCNYTDGYPAANYDATFINGEVVGDDEVLNYTYHGQSFYCEVFSNYSVLTGRSNPTSAVGNLTVYFGPEDLRIHPVLPDNKLYIPNNDSKPVIFKFQANDRNGSVSVYFEHEYVGLNGTLNKISDTDFTYHSRIFIDGSDDGYGKYNFSVETQNPQGSKSIFIEVVNSTDQIVTSSDHIVTSSSATTTFPQNPEANIALIAGICGGLGALIVFGIVVLLVKRRATKGEAQSEKEERANEVYGSSPGFKYGGDAKQETPNILYSASDPTEVIEEAYAGVDKKSNGNDNGAFAAEVSEVTYAAVKKPKKKSAEEPQEAVYSAVDKKKKKKSAGINSELHG